MRDYIKSNISSGTVDMCRGSYNLFVTNMYNDVSSYYYDGYITNDGQHCIAKQLIGLKKIITDTCYVSRF